MNIFLQIDLPEKLVVELQQDSFWTNTLLILNIIVSISIATFIKIINDKKAKRLENKSYIEKIKAEKKLIFCLNIYKIFKQICSKNPKNISDNDISEVNNIVISKELMLVSNKSEQDIKDFRDYILKIKSTPLKKDIRDEKSYFFLIENIIGDI